MSTPLVSIIIPTKNEELNIGRLLNSIYSTSIEMQKFFEVIVVDNINTTDRTRQIVNKFSAVLYVYGDERSEQRNHGVKKAHGEYVLFLDADMEVTYDLLLELLSLINSNERELMIFIPERIPGKSIYLRARNIEKVIYSENKIVSAARLFNREIFLKIGGFNQDMISGEDWDLSKRYEKLARKVFFTKNTLKHHEEKVGFIGSIKKKIYYAKNLQNYSVWVDAQINPFYRFFLIFSNFTFLFRDPIAYIYLIILKTFEFGIGFVTYLLLSDKKIV